MTRRALWGLVLVHLLAGLLFLSPGYIVPDSVGVVAWLRSAAIDHDLLFFNEWNGFNLVQGGVTLFKETTPVGAVGNHWWIGFSIVGAPVYLLASAVVWMAPSLGTGGFFGLEGAALAWNTVVLGLLVSVLVMRLLSGAAGGLGAARRALVLGLVWFGTPLFWYTFRSPFGTHVPAAAAIGLLCLLLLHEDATAPPWLGAAIGLAFGLAVACRIQHAVLAPAVVLALAGRRRPARIYGEAAVGVVLPLACQGIAWQVVYGNPLGPLALGGGPGGGTWEPLRETAFLNVLVSSWHGLFTWCPVVVFAVLGWLVRLRKDRVFPSVLLAMFAGEWIANAAFDRFWWGGMSFGPRRFLDLAVPFAIGLGWFVERLRPRALSLLLIAPAVWTVSLAGSAMMKVLNLSADPGGPGLLAQGSFRWLSGLPDSDALRSPVANPEFLRLTLLAIPLVVAVALFAAWLGRKPERLVIVSQFALAAICVALALTWGPTRRDAETEAARFGVDLRRAARVGPLLDARQLLGHRADHERTAGREEAERGTRREIEGIDALLRSINPSSAPRSADVAQPGGSDRKESIPVPAGEP